MLYINEHDFLSKSLYSSFENIRDLQNWARIESTMCQYVVFWCWLTYKLKFRCVTYVTMFARDVAIVLCRCSCHIFFSHILCCHVESGLLRPCVTDFNVAVNNMTVRCPPCYHDGSFFNAHLGLVLIGSLTAPHLPLIHTYQCNL